MRLEIHLQDPERIWNVDKIESDCFVCCESLNIRGNPYKFTKICKSVDEVIGFFEVLDVREVEKLKHKYFSK